MARGRAFALAAYHKQALESFQQALCLDPNQYEAAARLVILQLRTNQDEEALATATKLAEQAPDFQMLEMTSGERINVFTLLGNALLQNGRTQDAIEAYLTARTKSGGADTTASARLAQAYLTNGEPQKALDLAGTFAANPRFQELSAVLNLGATNLALLPKADEGAISRAFFPALDVHGRPLTVPSGARLAPAVHGDDAWCADLPDVLKDDALP